MIESSLLRVLFASHTANVGFGAENLLMSLVTWLKEAGLVDPVVAVPDEGGPMEAGLAAAGVETLRAPLTWWIGNSEQLAAQPHGFAGRVERMADILRRSGAQATVTNTCVIRELAEAARLADIPHVWYVHEILSRYTALNTPGTPGEAWLEMAGLSHSILCVSEAVRADILSNAPEAAARTRLEVIHTGIIPRGLDDPAEARVRLLAQTGFAQDSVIACFVGVLDERKGIMTLVESARRIATKFPRLHYAVMGADGGLEEAVREAIGRHGLENRFALLGRIENPQPLMQGADLAVMPSVADSFPLVAHEAMHLGLPLVATDSGGVAELLEEGITGRLVPVGDAAAVANSLAELAQDEGLRRRMGEAARRRIRSRFSVEHYVAKVGALLRSAADSRIPA